MKNKMSAKERALKMKYAFGGRTKYPTGGESGGELGPTPPPPPEYIPEAFQPFSQEYAMIPGKAPKPAVKKLRLKDTRTVNPATGKAYSKDKIGGKTLDIDPSILSTIVSHAKTQGIDPYDALAVAYQETGFGTTGTGLGESKDYFPDQDVSDSFNEIDERYVNEQANQLVKGLKDKLAYSKRLGFNKKGKAYEYQAYNGYGKLKAKKGETLSYYGIPVTSDNPLDMSVNPAYGKTVMSLKDLLVGNPDVKKIINEAKPFKAYSNFAQGGQAGADGWGFAGQMLPVIGNALMSIFDNKGYTNQPIMNAQTAKNMTSPYAFGGELDDIDSEQLKYYLQALFNNQAEAEDLDEEDYETLNEGIDEDEDIDEEGDEDTFAMGGKAKKKIHIKPENRGKFNALKKRTGKSTEQLTHSKNPLTRKRAIFAQNAAKWKHAMGGDIYANGGMTDIEVEGEEVVQTPDGKMGKVKGPSHDNGGVDMTVPEGTKIYSDRLQIEGKTMQQRKINREKRIASAAKVFGANPTSAIARNTMERTKQVVDREEQQDMALQKIANRIYSAPRKAAYGDEVGDPWSDNLYTMAGNNAQIPYMPGMAPLPNYQPTSVASADNTATPNVNIPVMAQSGAGFTPTAAQVSSAQAANQPATTYGDVAGLTTGDYVGLAGNLFNAIAPIINTRNARRATKPEINRFQGFGKQAMDANAKAQSFAGVQAANAKRNLDTATNSAILRNRLGARSVNTQRALDTVTDINRNKAEGDIYQGYTTQLTNLLGQEASLANQRDQIVMSGAQARDEREVQNTDNYYTNMAQNLTNFGTNIQGIGASLNTSKANRDNTALLESMSEYFDFGRDRTGKLVIKNKKK